MDCWQLKINMEHEQLKDPDFCPAQAQAQASRVIGKLKCHKANGLSKSMDPATSYLGWERSLEETCSEESPEMAA